MQIALIAFGAAALAGCGPAQGGMEVHDALAATKPIPIEVNYWQYRPDAVKIGAFRGHALRFDDFVEGSDPTYGFKIDTAGEDPVATECTVIMATPKRLDCKAAEENLSIRLDDHGVATGGEVEIPIKDAAAKRLAISVKSRSADGRQLTRGVGYQLADDAGPVAEMEMGQPGQVWMRPGVPRREAMLTTNVLIALYLLRVRLEGAVRLHPNINAN
jgi:hypothetical protein